MSTPQKTIIKTWNKETYEEFVKYMMRLQDIKYRDFSSSLILNSRYEMIGIRNPIMREDFGGFWGLFSKSFLKFLKPIFKKNNI